MTDADVDEEVAQFTSTKSSPTRGQGMADPQATSSGVSAAGTAPTVSNTACTSPLTITSLEQATAAGKAAANNSNKGVPAVVNGTTHLPQQPGLPELPSGVQTVDNMLVGPLAKLGLVASELRQEASVPQAVHPTQDILKPAMVYANTLPPPPPQYKHYHGTDNIKSRTPPTEHDSRKLFIGGLPADVTDGQFLGFFKQFGPVIDSVVMLDRATKRSRGFGFVTFAREEDAMSLLTAIPGKTGYVLINDKQCEVKASTPKVDDGRDSYKNHHHSNHSSGGVAGTPGSWRSNPPLHSAAQHHSTQGQGSRAHFPKVPYNYNQQYYAGKPMYTYNDQYIGDDADTRNFDKLYSEDIPFANANGRNNGYYGGPSYDASYPGQVPYGNQYPGGYYADPYGTTQYPSQQYGGQYGPPQTYQGYNNGYYSEGDVNSSEGGGYTDPYYQNYGGEVGGEYEQADAAAVESANQYD